MAIAQQFYKGAPHTPYYNKLMRKYLKFAPNALKNNFFFSERSLIKTCFLKSLFDACLGLTEDLNADEPNFLALVN